MATHAASQVREDFNTFTVATPLFRPMFARTFIDAQSASIPDFELTLPPDTFEEPSPRSPKGRVLLDHHIVTTS
jgi:hypothetical protein